MKQIISLLFFGLLCMNFQTVFAAQDKNTAPAAETPAASNVEQKNDANTYNVSDDFNFNGSSAYITDEQLEAAKNIDKIDDDNAGFFTRIINSSHFSSGTATKTWIPINKVQE